MRLRCVGVACVLAVIGLGLHARPAVAGAIPVCGNGELEAGEECDDGSLNGVSGACCTANCVRNGMSPDVIVGDIPSAMRHGNVGGITAYSIGSTSCNVGNCWLNWIANTAEHPLIGQSMYRLKDGRFEQVGQSWLKHGFGATTGSLCGTCNPPPDQTRLGVNCSDPYEAFLNGMQGGMGPKVDVNPATGVFPYPDSRIQLEGNAIFKRLQVHDADLDPFLNPGALYFFEAQYVTHDDATAQKNGNNVSYRRATVGAAPLFLPTTVDTTQRGRAGIEAWKATDPAVTQVALKGADGTFILAAKATPIPGGLYHYEYAVQNLTNNRAARSFTVPIPPGATITRVDFHDVDYHSGEPFDGTDWTATVTATSVSWATQPFDVQPNANALRWGTLYNFRFDANVAPGVSAVTLGLFKPGSPATVSAVTVTPSACGALPSEVREDVQLAPGEGGTTITWTPASGSATSSVLRGTVAQLPVGPGGGDEICLETDIAGSSATDPEDPDPGTAFWYLVRGENDCGDGTYGVASQGGVLTPRSSTTCP